jgi:hypothetical protein
MLRNQNDERVKLFLTPVVEVTKTVKKSRRVIVFNSRLYVKRKSQSLLLADSQARRRDQAKWGGEQAPNNFVTSPHPAPKNDRHKPL